MHPRARARPKFGDVSAGWGGGGDVKQVMACGFWCAAAYARRCGRYADGPCAARCDARLLDPIRRDATRDAAAGPDHRLLSFCTSQTSQRSPWPLVLFGRTADAMPMQRLQMLLARLRTETHLMQPDRDVSSAHQMQSDHGELRFQA
jgi:hypothetical protein